MPGGCSDIAMALSVVLGGIVHIATMRNEAARQMKLFMVLSFNAQLLHAVRFPVVSVLNPSYDNFIPWKKTAVHGMDICNSGVYGMRKVFPDRCNAVIFGINFLYKRLQGD